MFVMITEAALLAESQNFSMPERPALPTLPAGLPAGLPGGGDYGLPLPTGVGVGSGQLPGGAKLPSGGLPEGVSPKGLPKGLPKGAASGAPGGGEFKDGGAGSVPGSLASPPRRPSSRAPSAGSLAPSRDGSFALPSGAEGLSLAGDVSLDDETPDAASPSSRLSGVKRGDSGD